MALTRDFKDTVQVLVERDVDFRVGLLKEAVDNLLAGDVATGKLLLRDYINATVGFEVVADQVNTPPKSLHRMLGPKGNPRADNLFRLIALLQSAENVDLEVQVAPVDRRDSVGKRLGPTELMGVEELRAIYEGGVESTGKRLEATALKEPGARYAARSIRRKR